MKKYVGKVLKKQNAITLIALVITIIVLLILGGVTVATLTGENGLLKKAILAGQKNKEAEEDEKDKLSSYEDTIQSALGTRNPDSNLSNDELVDLIKQYANPTGTVIAYYSSNAPSGYLACDGLEYDLTQHPEYRTLATVLGVESTATKFKVPDLRGEFLRGTGTNSHANQGNGDEVGKHQDGTEHVRISGSSNGNLHRAEGAVSLGKPDTYVGTLNPTWNYYPRTGTYGSGTYDHSKTNYTSRPTNTSVLYCIKY